MLQPAEADQVAAFLQLFDHGLVGLALLALVRDDFATFEARGILGVEAVIGNSEGDRGVDTACFQIGPFGHPDFKVVRAVAGCRVHEACTGIVGDMVTVQQRHVEFVTAEIEPCQWMSTGQGFQLVVADGPDTRKIGDTCVLEHFVGEGIRQDQLVALLDPVVVRQSVLRNLVEAVVDARGIADGAVARDGPGRGRPDHDRSVQQFLDSRFIASAGTFDRELHPDHVGLVVLILDLGFGKRGLFRPPTTSPAWIRGKAGRRLRTSSVPGQSRLRSRSASSGKGCPSRPRYRGA